MAMASAIRRVIPKPDHDQTEILSICAVLCCLFEWVVSKGQQLSAALVQPQWSPQSTGPWGWSVPETYLAATVNCLVGLFH
jgi:hypothetical protein